MSKKTPQNRAKTRKRDERGQFLPGVSGNPGGRPVRGNIAESIRDYLSEEHRDGIDRTRHLLNKLYRLATERGDVPAAKALLSFGFGNPAQAVNLETRELPPAEQASAEFLEWLDTRPKMASSYKKYLLTRRKEESVLAGGNGNDSH